MDKIRTLHYGLGPIGSSIVRLASQRPRLQIVDAVDIAPAKVGRDLGEIIGLERPLGIAISDKPCQALRQADIAIHCTGSHLERVRGQLTELIEAGVNIVSTCEELAYPWKRHAAIACELDRRAKEKGVTILGTGVNPGFVMDTLAIVLTGVCQEVNRIRITRVVDASGRRLPLQKKVGAGLTIEEFEASAQAGTVRHVGLTESLEMVADALGWSLDRVEESLEPVLAEERVVTPFLAVEAGQVAGVCQVARGVREGEEALRLEMEMYVGAKGSRDEIVIEGRPLIHMVIEGGIHGDLATAAIVVNAIPRVVEAPPGLVTMKDLPLVGAWLH